MCCWLRMFVTTLPVLFCLNILSASHHRLSFCGGWKKTIVRRGEPLRYSYGAYTTLIQWDKEDFLYHMLLKCWENCYYYFWDCDIPIPLFLWLELRKHSTSPLYICTVGSIVCLQFYHMMGMEVEQNRAYRQPAKVELTSQTHSLLLTTTELLLGCATDFTNGSHSLLPLALKPTWHMLPNVEKPNRGTWKIPIKLPMQCQHTLRSVYLYQHPIVK